MHPVILSASLALRRPQWVQVWSAQFAAAVSAFLRLGRYPAWVSQRTTVMIVDDHEIVRRGIADVVAAAEGLDVVAEAASVADAVRRGELLKPEVALVDLQLPDGTGIDVIRSLAASSPDTRCIVLTSFDDDDAVAAAVEEGARAYVLKTVRGGEIVDVVRGVAAGRVLLDERTLTRRRQAHPDPTSSLTASESRVLDLVAKGMTNRDIADELGLAEKTVKNHVTSMLAKLGLSRRTQVIAWVANQRSTSWR